MQVVRHEDPHEEEGVALGTELAEARDEAASIPVVEEEGPLLDSPGPDMVDGTGSDRARLTGQLRGSGDLAGRAAQCATQDWEAPMCPKGEVAKRSATSPF
jgi:hypothetical protein